MNWKKIFTAAIITSCMIFGGNVSAAENNFTVEGIAEVYGDGEKISTAILEYPKKLNKNISAKNFEVEGKKIESLKVEGNKIILKFLYENTAFDGELKMGSRKNFSQEKNSRKNDAPMRSDRKIPELNFIVKQVGEILAEDGTKFLPSENKSEKISAPVIEKFQQKNFTDESGNSMPYNLYLPEGYDGEKKYPLVFFVADASANINEVTTPLFQGNGATSFAEKNFQEKKSLHNFSSAIHG